MTPNSTSGRRSTQLESRVGFMAARGIDTATTRFSTSFGRGLDYYTGFEFELHAKGNGVEPLVAGGRYDGLMTQLGSATADSGGRIFGVGRGTDQDRPQPGTPRREARHDHAVRSGRSFQGPPAGKRRGVLHPRRARSGKAARRPRLSRHHHRASTMSRSPISRRARSPRSLRAARCISASPARIWCARASPMPTSACC